MRFQLRKRSGIVAFASIFVVALAVRLLHVWQIRRAPFFSVLMGDSRAYDEWAQRIAGGDWFGSEVFYQAPLYPYFLGGLYATFGRNLLLVRVVQALVGSASCVLVALAAEKLFSRRAGVVAGLILAVYAPAIFFDGLLQKSVLDVFFVCLALWLIARIVSVRLKADPTNEKRDTGRRKRERARDARGVQPNVRRVRLQPDLHWVALGLVIGGLSLTRENALVFVVVLLAWALMAGPGRGVRPAAAFLIGLAIVLVPVAARNSLVGGGFYLTTSQFGPNFFIGNNPRADGTYASLRYGRGAPEYERRDATEIAEATLARRLTPAEVSSFWADRALDFITSQPAAWLRLLARKALLLWNRVEVVDTEDQATHADWSLPLRLGGAFGHFGVLVPLAVLGLIATWPLRSRLIVLYAMLAAYAASVLAFYVFARYRYPLVPLLVPFAAGGVLELVEARRIRWPLLATAISAAVLANWPILSTAFMRAVTENNLAAALQAEHRLDEAVAHYERAIALRPHYAPAYSNLGTAERARARLDRAVADYEQAITLQPEYPDAHYNLANALLDLGQVDRALEHFRIALRLAPGSVDMHNNFGIALAAKGDHEDAIREFQTAVRLDPASAKSRRNLGDALLAAGRGGEALEEFRRAVELTPDDGALRYDYGSVLLEAQRPVEAAAELRAALATMPDSVEAHNNLGIALGSQGKLEEAIAEFETALKLRPGFEDARRNLEMAREARGRTTMKKPRSPQSSQK